MTSDSEKIVTRLETFLEEIAVIGDVSRIAYVRVGTPVIEVHCDRDLASSVALPRENCSWANALRFVTGESNDLVIPSGEAGASSFLYRIDQTRTLLMSFSSCFLPAAIAKAKTLGLDILTIEGAMRN